jgi:hypothetical protein
MAHEFPVNAITINVPVPKIGESIALTIPVEDTIGWLTIGVARVLGDAHAGIAKDSGDAATVRAAVFAAIMKRFDGGPGGNRAAPGTVDPVDAELFAIIGAKLKKGGVKITELKTTTLRIAAWRDMVTAHCQKVGVAVPDLTAALERHRLAAAAIAESRKIAIGVDDLI